ncbi:MAG: hypothetical protein ABFS14_10630 [Gemmatimonadota bacterium]
MSDTDRTSRRYTDKEIGLILRRASSLQRAEPSGPDPSGFTLAELEDVALEAGIDTRLLRQAAAELDAGETGTLGQRLAGGPTTIRFERTVAGEIPKEKLGDLIAIIERATDGHGQASAVGHTLSWASTNPGATTSQQVLVSSKDGETVISIEEQLGNLAGALFGGLLGGVGGGAGIGLGGALGGVLSSVVLGIGIPIVAIGGTYLATRRLYASIAGKHKRKLSNLLEAIASHVEDVVEPERLVAPAADLLSGSALDTASSE